jgi:hypothetical protein
MSVNAYTPELTIALATKEAMIMAHFLPLLFRSSALIPNPRSSGNTPVATNAAPATGSIMVRQQPYISSKSDESMHRRVKVIEAGQKFVPKYSKKCKTTVTLALYHHLHDTK